MTDEELVRRMQRGDMQAFDELYERYKDDAYRVACLITGNRADGEDLTQEAFVTAARSIGSLKRRVKVPALAAQDAVPRGVEILPQGKARDPGRGVFRDRRKRERAFRGTPHGRAAAAVRSAVHAGRKAPHGDRAVLLRRPAGERDRAHARRDRGDGQIPPVFRPPPSAAGADRKRGKAKGGCSKWMN